jgi:hypothetical protein
MRELRLVLPAQSEADIQELVAQARVGDASWDFEELLFSRPVCQWSMAALRERLSGVRRVLEEAEIGFPEAEEFAQILHSQMVPPQLRGVCVYLIAVRGVTSFGRLWLGFRPGALPARLLRRFAQLQAITVFAHLEGKHREYAKYAEEYLNCYEVAEYDEANRIAAPMIADYANEKDENKMRLALTLLAVTDISDYRAAMGGCACLLHAREAFQRDEGGVIDLLASRLRLVCQAAWRARQRKIQRRLAAEGSS